MSKESYEKNRLRVCEIYGVDPDKASVHHICQRSDIKRGGFRNLFPTKESVNAVSNLYPFSDKREDGRELHTRKIDHALLHQRLEKIEPVVIYSSKKKKKRKK